MDGWSLALFGLASFVAVTSLVYLMNQRRDRMLADFRGRMLSASSRKKATPPQPASEQSQEAA
jgi:hypothetical protein